MKQSHQLFLLTLLCALAVGCKPEQVIKAKSPRPVAVLSLTQTDPAQFDRYTGTVASWKTDQLGFEVAGRVEFVAEPETEINQAAIDQQNGVAAGGTELARLDPTRYELSVQSAKAAIVTAEKKRDAAQIELDSVVPAQLEAAQAQLSMANTEVARYEELVPQGAAPERELDVARSKRDQAVAQMKQLEATRESKRAEVASLEANIGELQETLRQAERDLADCRLKWFVPGQIAKVHVIAGSYVDRGEPVVTVQMMHPMKVEIEVSGATARTLNHRDQVKVSVPQPDGSMLEQLGFIYMIDPVADPNTRTFTITLLLSNRVIRGEMPDEYKEQVVARTDTIAKIIRGFASEPNSLFVSEPYLSQDEEGHFVWKVLNRRVGTLTDESERMLQVKKVRVVPGELRVPVLGLAVLQEIQLVDGEQFDPAVDVITGKLTLPPGAEEAWTGDQVFYDSERWELRPGDLVSVDLSASGKQPGFFVPLDAIMEKTGTNYVFVVEPSENGDTVRRVEVSVHEAVGTLRRIEAIPDQQLGAGAKIVAAGAVFLVDGERVNVAEEVEVKR